MRLLSVAVPCVTLPLALIHAAPVGVKFARQFSFALLKERSLFKPSELLEYDYGDLHGYVLLRIHNHKVTPLMDDELSTLADVGKEYFAALKQVVYIHDRGSPPTNGNEDDAVIVPYRLYAERRAGLSPGRHLDSQLEPTTTTDDKFVPTVTLKDGRVPSEYLMSKEDLLSVPDVRALIETGPSRRRRIERGR